MASTSEACICIIITCSTGKLRVMMEQEIKKEHSDLQGVVLCQTRCSKPRTKGFQSEQSLVDVTDDRLQPHQRVDHALL